MLIRPITSADEPFLWEMLYQAIHVEPGSEPPSRDILTQPDIAHYVAEWGKDGDYGFIAEANAPIGAAWLRLFSSDDKGYGYVADDVPELSIAILPEYRGQGVGTHLMVDVLDYASSKYTSISLSVSPNNPARRLYERFGFKQVGINGTSITMQVHVTPSPQTGWEHDSLVTTGLPHPKSLSSNWRGTFQTALTSLRHRVEKGLGDEVS